MPKRKIKLFTDGSVNPQLKVGYGACLIVEDDNLTFSELSKIVKTKMFANTSSTKLELQTLLWALTGIDTYTTSVTIYTDSQNSVGLLSRRSRLEEQNYMTKKNKLIANHKLYKEFYNIVDKIDCSIIKVEGHKKEENMDDIDTIFSLVDKASRDALRDAMR